MINSFLLLQEMSEGNPKEADSKCSSSFRLVDNLICNRHLQVRERRFIQFINELGITAKFPILFKVRYITATTL